MPEEVQVDLSSSAVHTHDDSEVPVRQNSDQNDDETTPQDHQLFNCICGILSGLPFIGKCMQRHKDKALESDNLPTSESGAAGQQNQQNQQQNQQQIFLGNIPRKVKEQKWQRTMHVLEPLRVLVYLVVILIFSLSIPKLRDRPFLDLAPLWQWVLFAILIVGGNAFTYLLGNWLVALLAWNYRGSKKGPYYFEGLEQSIHFALFSSLFLLTNAIYFANTDLNTHINKAAKYKGTPLYTIFTRYVIATSLAGVIAALLWLVKTYLLLKLKAAQVYRRLEHKIEKMTEPVWFLAIISGHYSHKELTKYLRKILVPSNGRFDKMFWKAKYFMNISKTSKSRDEEDKKIQKFLDKCDQKINLQDWECIRPNHLRNLGMESMDEEEAKKLFFKVKESSPQSSSPSASLVTYASFKKWLVKTYMETVQLGHTLRDCRAALYHLDRVFIAVTIYLVGAWWLIMTGNGSTKVLVVIAFPITAAGFMFQDVGKNMFEGIVFTFLKHPFDVGDLCIIDGDQLEVKRLGIAMTVFYKDESKAEVKIPNSVLADKSITNLKSMPDALDYLELNLDPSTTYQNITVLKTMIESDKSIPNSRPDGNETFIEDEGKVVDEVIVKQMEGSIKLFVYFKHDISADNEMEYSKFLRTKNKRRSHLLLKLKERLDILNIKLVAPPPN